MVILALVLSACAKDPPPPVLVAAETPLPTVAPECKSAGDRDWQDLPAGDVRESVAARNHRVNKQQYRDMQAKRRICDASITAHGLSAPQAVASAAR
jgi:hypothetical protein